MYYFFDFIIIIYCFDIVINNFYKNMYGCKYKNNINISLN